MSYTILMQDWVTVRGNAAATVVLQPEVDWVDFSAFQDIASYIEVADISGTATAVKIQTAPVKEEAYFTVTGADLASVTAVGTTVTVVRWATATTPPARWLRWRCSATGAGWSVTFRIHLNGNPVGQLLGGMPEFSSSALRGYSAMTRG